MAEKREDALEAIAEALKGIQQQLSEIRESVQLIAHYLEDSQQLPPQARMY